MVESTKPQVVERVEMHEHLTANRPLQMRSDGVTKRKRVGGGSATADQTESFSDNDDSEVAGYLNSKGESDYKKTIREKINALVVERIELHKKLTANRPLQMRSDGVTKRKRVGGGSATADQTESFSDNDDSEVAGYLNSKGESDYKKTIREKINALVVERFELRKKLTANRPLQMRSDGVTKRKRVGGGSATADQTESFSDIDDSEVAGYLNSKEESHYKKIIWEKINQQLAMEQAKRKKESESKKDKPGKGTAKTTKIDENKIRSSKVNYEALKQLTDELNQDIGDAEIVGGSRSLSCVNSGGSNAKEVEVYESNSDELEEEEENPCSEDDGALRDSNYELYDEHEYGYDIDYGHV